MFSSYGLTKRNIGGTVTKEGAAQYKHSLNDHLEFFSKAGSLRKEQRGFYSGQTSALELFKRAWQTDKEIAFKLLLWLRDCRGGAGNRSGAREIYTWLAQVDPLWIVANIYSLPQVGRWDDLRSLFGTTIEDKVATMWSTALVENNVLAAKWADRKDKPLQIHLGLDEARLRKFLSDIRKDYLTEKKMCEKSWKQINYEHVPSVAMARYTNAFVRNDGPRFEKFKKSVEKGSKKINATTLFPHDCVITARHGDRKTADLQFNALPNYLEGTNERIIVISDTSGSMSCFIGGKVQAVDVSQALALYCSEKIGKENPFYRKFIGFCSESKFKDWNGRTFSDAVRNRDIFDGAIGATRIDTALNFILTSAQNFGAKNEHMPTTLLIISDMQFHSGCKSEGTEVEKAMKRWEEAGYNRPKIVYWNTAGYPGSQATANHKDIAMISGFSPAILASILSYEDMSPINVMMKAIDKYKIIVP